MGDTLNPILRMVVLGKKNEFQIVKRKQLAAEMASSIPLLGN